MKILESIDLKSILDNLGKTAIKVKEGKLPEYAIFMEPNSFKDFGYNQLGFNITKTSEWLESATKDILRDAILANKIVRVTQKSGHGIGLVVKTICYIVSSTFYNGKIGTFMENK
jgi:hypothetical protein